MFSIVKSCEDKQHETWGGEPVNLNQENIIFSSDAVWCFNKSHFSTVESEMNTQRERKDIWQKKVDF